MQYNEIVEKIQFATSARDIELICDETGLVFGNFEEQSMQFAQLANIYRGLAAKWEAVNYGPVLDLKVAGIL